MENEGKGKTITLYMDSEHKKRFKELHKILKKPKSQILRDMIDFFWKYKNNLSNGINIVISIPTPETNQNNTTEAIQD